MEKQETFITFENQIKYVYRENYCLNYDMITQLCRKQVWVFPSDNDPLSGYTFLPASAASC